MRQAPEVACEKILRVLKNFKYFYYTFIHYINVLRNIIWLYNI